MSLSLAVGMTLGVILLAAPALSNDFERQRRQDVLNSFELGRQAAKRCAMLAGDPGQHGSCIYDVVWRPYGQTLKAASLATDCGAKVEGVIQVGRIRADGLLIVMDLDDCVRKIGQGRYKVFCAVFEIDCGSLLRYRAVGLEKWSDSVRLGLVLDPDQ